MAEQDLSDAGYQKLLRERLLRQMDEYDRGVQFDQRTAGAARADEGRFQRDALMNQAMQKMASQAGSLNGKTSDTSLTDTATKGLLGSQQNALQMQDKQKLEQDKLQQYLMGKMLDQEGSLSKNALERAKMAQIAQIANNKLANEPKKLTKAQEAVDKAFAKTYEDWAISGGSTKVEKGLKELKFAADKLDKNPSLTGYGQKLIPDLALGVFKPDAINTRDSVLSVAQNNMKELLGGQFTEQEGKNVLARAYNENLPASENARRVRLLTEQMEAMAAAKNAAAKWYEEWGTLDGYKGRTSFSVDELARGPGFDEAPKSGAPGISETANAATPSVRDQQALKWVQDPKNAQDPRLPALKQSLKAKGML